MLTISQAAQLLGVSKSSLRRWDKNGLLSAFRTPGGHRRYSLAHLQQFYRKSSPLTQKSHPQQRIVCYARVSGYKQKEKGDLTRQIEILRDYAVQQGDLTPILLKDVGSGLNSSRPGLVKLFRLVREGKVSKIIVSYKDRLTRFGFSYIYEYCRLFGVSIIEIAQKQDKSVQERLVDDMMTLIACFSGKLYGMRSKKTRRSHRRRKSQRLYFQKVIGDEIWRIIYDCIPNCYSKPYLRKLLI